jgi:polyphosphate:AMP phosphotransferase
MLQQIDLNQTLSQKAYKKEAQVLENRLGELQREIKRLGIPVIAIFEGWSASGKGTMINRLIRGLDPRGFQVYSIHKETQEEASRPYLWRFWTKTPKKGEIALFDRSWYTPVIKYRKRGDIDRTVYDYRDILTFEKQLTDSGAVIIKFFLHISKKEQESRFRHLEEKRETSWRVDEADWKQNQSYEEYVRFYNQALSVTDTAYAPWTVVEASDENWAAAKVMHTVIQRLEEEASQRQTVSFEDEPEKREDAGCTVLDAIDLSKTMDKKTYHERVKKAKERLWYLQNQMYVEKKPAVIVFEGWDAAGKGGAIKRLTQPLDPRAYRVYPTAAPTEEEAAHHYLWRFWNNIPTKGHISIFDRSWYGRVMVERIEGLCTKEEWSRAYREINQMEEALASAGIIIIKFWLDISKEEQAKRFRAREENPEKQWKLTGEDWRNREKWDEYRVAVDEMIKKTSTPYAPWTIVEANSKYYARVKVLEAVVDRLKRGLEDDITQWE